MFIFTLMYLEYHEFYIFLKFNNKKSRSRFRKPPYIEHVPLMKILNKKTACQIKVLELLGFSEL